MKRTFKTVILIQAFFLILSSVAVKSAVQVPDSVTAHDDELGRFGFYMDPIEPDQVPAGADPRLSPVCLDDISERERNPKCWCDPGRYPSSFGVSQELDGSECSQCQEDLQDRYLSSSWHAGSNFDLMLGRASRSPGKAFRSPRRRHVEQEGTPMASKPNVLRPSPIAVAALESSTYCMFDMDDL